MSSEQCFLLTVGVVNACKVVWTHEMRLQVPCIERSRLRTLFVLPCPALNKRSQVMVHMADDRGL